MTSSPSRTSKTIHNSAVALGIYFINLILQFYSRKIFLEYLGDDILGLNTTLNNILQFLNLTELGIGSAVGFSLYQPLYQKDKETINDILSFQRILYRRIACIILVGAGILMLFFPWIFKKMDLPLWYAYFAFAGLLFSSLLGYFVNYKQIVLSASQQEYKILLSYKTAHLVKILFQIAAVSSFSNPFIWWVGLEIAFAGIGSAVLHYVTKKSFPFLRKSLKSFRQLRQEYRELGKKIKQLFFHKIGGFALTQTSPLVIYAYASLTLVTYYSNYMIIIMGLMSLVSSIFNSQTAGVGNLVAEGNEDNIIRVFKDLFALRFIICASICVCAYFMIPSFIRLWIGGNYLLSNTALLLMIGALFIQIFRASTDSFINAYGLYGDIWAPIAEASINIGFSVLLGYYFGLDGVLAGVLISLILIVAIWKPYYLFRNGLKKSIWMYIGIYLKQIVLLIPGITICYYYSKIFNIAAIDNWRVFVYQLLIMVLLIMVPMLGLNLIAMPSLRQRFASFLHR